MNDPFPVVYPARQGETAWSLTGRHTGKKKWSHHVDVVVDALVDALDPTDVVIGGGNVKLLKSPTGAYVII